MTILDILYGLISFLLVPGTALMLLFCVLSGGVDSFPFNTFYWVQADTSSIPQADADVTRWTFWGICNPSQFSDAKQGTCSNLGPAVPISPLNNWGSSTDLPTDFINNSSTYYYLSRFAFAFILIALIFTGISLINIIVSPFWKSFKRANVLYLFLAMLLATAGAACGTGVSVLTRNKFKDMGADAKLDSAFFGMLWASVFCLLVMFFLSCCTATYGAYKEHNAQQEATVFPDLEGPVPTNYDASKVNEEFPVPAHESSGIKFFKIKRNTSSDDAA